MPDPTRSLRPPPGSLVDTTAPRSEPAAPAAARLRSEVVHRVQGVVEEIAALAETGDGVANLGKLDPPDDGKVVVP
jgi:hypothetical protein